MLTPSIEGSPEAETPSDATLSGTGPSRRSQDLPDEPGLEPTPLSLAPPPPSPGLPLSTLVVDDDR